mmetsp:Transcript_20826/g.35512  ORF Transcript_20826/g.35512 Transcript_20826/m.35512 type:complete len:330 (-) Transcript_20826:312-1301(-)
MIFECYSFSKFLCTLLSLSIVLVGGGLSPLPIIRCFSDPVSEFNDFPSCVSCNHDRHMLAFINHYRVELLNQEQHARNATICLDFQENCFCRFTSTLALCTKLPTNFAVVVGDSMLRTLVQEFVSLCHRNDVFRFTLPKGYFDPTNNAHRTGFFTAIDKWQAPVVMLNYAFHFLSLQGPREVDRKIFTSYESSIDSVIGKVQIHSSVIRTIWLLSNSVCVDKYNGAYAQAIRNYNSGNVSWLQQKFTDWRKVLLSSFDRSGALLLNNRARRFLRQNYPTVSILDGFAATDFMCQFTTVGDGRHFQAIRRLKLDMFFHLTRDLLPKEIQF